MKYKLYSVGGAVRDELLGLRSKDIDYSVVLEDTSLSPEEGLRQFVAAIETEGYEIFLVTEDCFTVRARFPKNHIHSGPADFVLARREVGYIEGTRRPISVLGTLEDDLRRRDFTVNAMAKDDQGELIDIFNGRQDLRFKSLDTPGDPNESFMEDPLRIIRGMRFCITKNFTFCSRVREAISQYGISGMEVVSNERIREELLKCFMFNTKKTLNTMIYMEQRLGFPIMSYCFDTTGIRLEPTMKS